MTQRNTASCFIKHHAESCMPTQDCRIRVASSQQAIPSCADSYPLPTHNCIYMVVFHIKFGIDRSSERIKFCLENTGGEESEARKLLLRRQTLFLILLNYAANVSGKWQWSLRTENLFFALFQTSPVNFIRIIQTIKHLSGDPIRFIFFHQLKPTKRYKDKWI